MTLEVATITGDFSANLIRQAGALCFRPGFGKETEILLVSSRRTGKWGIPKGHMEAGETAYEGAIREAYEEAGIIGVATRDPIGSFRYLKANQTPVYSVCLHGIRVVESVKDFPEKGQRLVWWLPVSAAAREVANADLGTLILKLSQLAAV